MSNDISYKNPNIKRSNDINSGVGFHSEDSVYRLLMCYSSGESSKLWLFIMLEAYTVVSFRGTHELAWFGEQLL